MRFLIGLAVLLTPLTASAQNFTGLDMLRACQIAINPPTDADVGTYMKGARCLGFLDGMMDTTSIVTAVTKGQTNLFCAPKEGIGLEQAARIVVKYLTENPNDLHMPARMQAMVAFRVAFPCN